MAVLARKANKPNYWVEANDPKNWENDNFPYEVLRELEVRGEGVSFWRLESEQDTVLDRIAAEFAYSSNNDTIPSIQFQIVDEQVVLSLGIDIIDTKGKFKDPDLATYHRDLKNITGKQAIKLVEHLMKSSRDYSSKDVAEHVASGIINGHLPLPLSQKLLKALERSNHIKVI